MNPWLFPWWGLFKWPLSGDVTQDIAPNTSWLSPQFEFNFAGNRRIEATVVADVASYGKQLGILSEAMLELADGKNGLAVERLKALTDQIDEVKHQYEDRLEQKVKADLDQLKQKDQKALKRLLDQYR
jgi:3-deoxy-D-manno-octulosonic-acid transferase